MSPAKDCVDRRDVLGGLHGPRGGAGRDRSRVGPLPGPRESVAIQLWPKEIGADYLIARTGRGAEREAAEDLSEALGGLPLAHEQATAYCERLEIPLAGASRPRRCRCSIPRVTRRPSITTS